MFTKLFEVAARYTEWGGGPIPGGGGWSGARATVPAASGSTRGKSGRGGRSKTRFRYGTGGRGRGRRKVIKERLGSAGHGG